MKKIGFLSFGHWSPSPQSQTRSASDALMQSIDLAVATEELGADGAYFRDITSPANSDPPSHCWLLSARRPSGLRLARRSSICAMRTLCTWQRTPVRPASSMSASKRAPRRPGAKTCAIRRDLVEQGFGLLQIARVEAFGEPAVDRSKQFASLLRLALITPEPRHAHRGAEFPARSK